MYSIAKNVQIVIALLKAHNINQLVLNPGGTNAAFVRGVQEDSFFQCYSVVDERSALYFAIGVYLATGKPVAVCCTSAQATRNYIPGLTEAYYKHAPILAITFSKHYQYIGQDYMQAPNQTSLPVDSVKKSYALPYISNDHDRLQCERMTNEAILDLLYPTSGPIQLNIPMLDNELSIDNAEALPRVKAIRRVYANEICDLSLDNKRVLVVVGENRGLDDLDIQLFAKKQNAVIYVNHLSNMRNDNTVEGNLFLTQVDQETFDKYYSPDILITIGGQTGDYPLFHKLSDSKKTYEHWRVAEDGSVVDTYDHLTKVICCDVTTFFRMVKSNNPDSSYLELWREEVSQYKTDIELPLSNCYVAQKLKDIIPQGSILNFSILNSLRSWNLFHIRNRVKCFCNVGAFGIDGCISTFIGQSVTTESLCFMIVGDLSFYYDMNSLGIRHIKNNIRIILVNNNGGVEFKLGGTEEQHRKIDNYIAAANHFKQASGWAVDCGFDYILVKDKLDFEQYKNKLIEKNDKPILMEIQIPDIYDSTAYRTIIKNNDRRTLSTKIITRISNELKKRFN